jgi:hypothetical protein
MTIRKKTRARTCLANKRYIGQHIFSFSYKISRLTGVTVLASPSRIQSCRTVRLPTQAIVNNPTHLTLRVAPRPRPVIANQNHQLAWNAFDGPCSCWLVKDVNANPVKAVMIIRGESRRINRAWVRRPFSVQG